MGFGYWIVEDAANGALVGTVGFQEARRTMQPSIEGTPEAGWVFAPATHGKGLASEAVAAMLAWSDGALDAPETTCIIEPANTKSIALALRFGFRPDGAADYNGVTVAILRRPRGGR